MQQHLPWTPPVEAVHQRVQLRLGGDGTQTVALGRLDKHCVRERLRADSTQASAQTQTDGTYGRHTTNAACRSPTFHSSSFRSEHKSTWLDAQLGRNMA
jgi:hypothetical protein